MTEIGMNIYYYKGPKSTVQLRLRAVVSLSSLQISLINIEERFQNLKEKKTVFRGLRILVFSVIF